ncbi:unnamed protein product [Linum trigynum]|uniref:Uncharacterized protein n=1 Tax=Linum trigynum TaxID=586398 RepID=A0AAV2C9N4_9ROSI
MSVDDVVAKAPRASRGERKKRKETAPSERSKKKEVAPSERVKRKEVGQPSAAENPRKVAQVDTQPARVVEQAAQTERAAERVTERAGQQLPLVIMDGDASGARVDASQRPEKSAAGSLSGATLQQRLPEMASAIN